MLSRGPSPRGSSLRGLSLRGSSPRGLSLRGPLPRGSSPRGPSPRGLSLRGSLPRGPSPRGSSPRGPSPRGPLPRGPLPRGLLPRGPLLRGPLPRGLSPGVQSQMRLLWVGVGRWEVRSACPWGEHSGDEKGLSESKKKRVTHLSSRNSHTPVISEPECTVPQRPRHPAQHGRRSSGIRRPPQCHSS